MIAAKWQLFSWAHEPVSEIFDVFVPNEITLGQLVAEFVGPYFQGRISSDSRYRWRCDVPLEQVPEGFVFEIETMMIPGMKEYLNELDLVSVKFEDLAFKVQMRRGSRVVQCAFSE
jgi:hypothetical protein